MQKWIYHLYNQHQTCCQPLQAYNILAGNDMGKTWFDVFVFADETAEDAAADDIKNTSLGSTSSNFSWGGETAAGRKKNLSMRLCSLPFLIALSLPR